jgi:hypothetical protein
LLLACNRLIGIEWCLSLYPSGSSTVGDGVRQQRHATQRVLPESGFDLRHTESASKAACFTSPGQEFAKLLFRERFFKSNALTAQRRIALLSAMLSEAVVERRFRPELLPHTEAFLQV